jgi:hypothetical protein
MREEMMEEEGQGLPSCPGLSHTVLGRAGSLVLLNQQLQAIRLGQGHVSVHTKVVSAGPVLAAQVTARRKA